MPIDVRYESWLRPGVASQMRNLVAQELANGDQGHPPYRYFVMAMEYVIRHIDFRARHTMLDAGCGVGHYAHIVHRYWPHINYHGFDFSKHMVEKALAWSPNKGFKFFVADAKEFDYSGYDIVLASSLIEVMDEWAEGAQAICETARGFVILHRVRTHHALTVREEHEGYEGQPTYAWVHEPMELVNFFEDRGLDLQWWTSWDEFRDRPFNMTTYIFRKL